MSSNKEDDQTPGGSRVRPKNLKRKNARTVKSAVASALAAGTVASSATTETETAASTRPPRKIRRVHRSGHRSNPATTAGAEGAVSTETATTTSTTPVPSTSDPTISSATTLQPPTTPKIRAKKLKKCTKKKKKHRQPPPPLPVVTAAALRAATAVAVALAKKKKLKRRRTSEVTAPVPAPAPTPALPSPATAVVPIAAPIATLRKIIVPHKPTGVNKRKTGQPPVGQRRVVIRPTTHWGELDDIEAHRLPTIERGKAVRRKLQRLMPVLYNGPQEPNDLCLTLDNPIVTQSIEVQHQSDMIRSLIDTYTSNNTTDPCQLMPQIDFPPGNSADLLRATVDDRFRKPLWFTLPAAHAHRRPAPQPPPERLSGPAVRRSMRKSCGALLRLKGFHEATHTSLVALAEGVDVFLRLFMTTLANSLIGESRELRGSYALDVPTLERGYFALRRASLLSLHNYYKHDVVQRNQTEHREFQEIYGEYDRLMRESQQLHKRVKSDEYMDLEDFTGQPGGGGDEVMAAQAAGGASGGAGGIVVSGVVGGLGAVNVLSYLDGNSGNPSAAVGTAGFQAIFDANTLVSGPSNATTGEQFHQRYGAGAGSDTGNVVIKEE